MALDADRAMDSIMFREEDEEEAAVTRKEEDESDARGGSPAVHKYCTNDIWSEGWPLIDEMDVRGVRRASDARTERRKRVNKFIVGRVRKMKESVAVTTIVQENVDAEVASWTSYVRRINSK